MSARADEVRDDLLELIDELWVLIREHGQGEIAAQNPNPDRNIEQPENDAFEMNDFAAEDSEEPPNVRANPFAQANPHPERGNPLVQANPHPAGGQEVDPRPPVASIFNNEFAFSEPASQESIFVGRASSYNEEPGIDAAIDGLLALAGVSSEHVPDMDAAVSFRGSMIFGAASTADDTSTSGGTFRRPIIIGSTLVVDGTSASGGTLTFGNTSNAGGANSGDISNFGETSTSGGTSILDGTSASGGTWSIISGRTSSPDRAPIPAPTSTLTGSVGFVETYTLNGSLSCNGAMELDRAIALDGALASCGASISDLLPNRLPNSEKQPMSDGNGQLLPNPGSAEEQSGSMLGTIDSSESEMDDYNSQEESDAQGPGT